MPKSLGAAPRRIPYLDGLRAYSIMVVLLSHSARFIQWRAGPATTPILVFFTQGDFGVRIFFVLSGFLITALLLEELEKSGTISISGFYERRIARIFPAFYCYVLTIIALKWLHEVDLQWPVLVVAATYTWNYSILWSAPNWDPDGILAHFWSLALEEQFYLVWPACLFFLGPRWAKRIALAAVMTLPFARVANYYLMPDFRGQVMMMFHTGADQIL